MMQLAHFLESISVWGLDIAVRSAIVLVVAALVAGLMRRASAASRHYVWAAALVGIVSLPLISVAVPFRIDLPLTKAVTAQPASDIHPTQPAATTMPPLFAAAVTPAEALGTETPAASAAPRDPYPSPILNAMQAPAPEAGNWAQLNWAALAAAAWLAGIAIAFLPVAVGWFSLQQLERRSSPLPYSLQYEFDLAVAAAGLQRQVRGVLSSDRNIPMTWGVLNPVVLMPVDATEWTAERRRVVLMHELAHVRRMDCLTQFIGQSARAINWFNPMAWWALSQLRLEQEQACDDAVLNYGAAPADYAAELLSVTARLPSFNWDSAVALAMGRATRLERRLSSILDEHRNRRMPTLSRLIAGSLATGLLICSLAILQPAVVKAQAATDAKPAQAPAHPIAVPVTQAPPAPAPAKKPETTPKAGSEVAATDKSISLQSVRELIEAHSATEIKAEHLNEAAIRGMVESLKDPYSTFINSEQLQQFQQQLDGNLVGIGAALMTVDKRIVVQNILHPDAPAAKGGLQRGDEILEVDGQPIIDLERTVKAVRGPGGSEVKVKVRRGQEELTLSFIRQQIRLSPIRGVNYDEQSRWNYWLSPQNKIGYIQITDFNATVASDLKTALKGLHEQGIKGLVLDLRMNPGGLLQTCVEVAQLFLKDSTIVAIKARKPEQDMTFKTTAEALYPDLPLIVVVDRYTGSAAEVLTAALKDNGRAIVIGERTFGKGSVQSILPLDATGTALKLTTAQLVSPAGQKLNREAGATQWGIDPGEGYFIPLTAEQRGDRQIKALDRQSRRQSMPAETTVEEVEKEWSDPALAAALKAMQGKLTSGAFPTTGRPLIELHAQLAQQAELRRQRDEFRKKLEVLDRELGDLK